MDWTTPSDDGSSSLTGYVLYWDQGAGDGNFVQLAVTNTATKTFAKSTGLTTGQVYQFKVAAQNAIGLS